MPRWLVWPIFGLVMGFALGGSFFWGWYGPNRTVKDEQVTREQLLAEPDTKSNKEKSDDALARYTLWLTAFTGVLALATIGLGVATTGLYLTGERQIKIGRRTARRQFLQTNKSIQVANRSAAAAERALTELERPWLFVEGATVKRREIGTQAPIPNNWYISFRCRNVGRSPAVIEECIVVFADKDTLPPKADYVGAAPLDTQRWASPNEPFDTREIGPSPTRGTKSGKPIEFVAYGRITYTELNGKKHHTGFAVSVSPHIAAFSSYNNDAYDYYD